jgi:hypothetical protein
VWEVEVYLHHSSRQYMAHSCGFTRGVIASGTRFTILYIVYEIMINAPTTVLTAPVTVTLYMRLGGHQSRSGRCGEEKYVLHMPGIEPRLVGLLAHSLVSISIHLAPLPFLLPGVKVK